MFLPESNMKAFTELIFHIIYKHEMTIYIFPFTYIMYVCIITCITVDDAEKGNPNILMKYADSYLYHRHHREEKAHIFFGCTFSSCLAIYRHHVNHWLKSLSQTEMENGKRYVRGLVK